MADDDLFVIKQGTTKPQFRATLWNGTMPANRQAVDLTTATRAHLFVKNRLGLKISVDITIDNQTTNLGGVYYTCSTSDTDTPGTYQAEVEITWSDNSTETFPGDGYFVWQIVPSLGP